MQGRVELALKREQLCRNILEDLPHYVTEYYENMSASREQTTCRAYLNIIRYFFETVGESHGIYDIATIMPSEFKENDISNFIVKSGINKETGQETTFGHRRVTWYALKSFFQYLFKMRYIYYNPVELVDKVKNQDRVERNVLTPTQIKILLDGISEEANKTETEAEKMVVLGDKAITSILANTGMRIEACISMNLNDLDFDTAKITVIDKRHKKFVYELNKNAARDLAEYLMAREVVDPEEKEEPMFLTLRRKRVNKDIYNSRLTKYAQTYIGTKLHAHQLRASFCTNLYEVTKDIEFVRRAVGHQNINTTMKYIKDDGNSNKRAGGILDKLYS